MDFIINKFYFSFVLLRMQAISRGWKPGAISKRLVRKLNKAKLQVTHVDRLKPRKKTKKIVEQKPTLFICKNDGEYRVEMKVTGNKNDGNSQESYDPLVYKIASANNEAKIKKRERRQKRLIRDTIREVWSDPYHPEACEDKCVKVYKQAIGELPFDINNPDCVCPEEIDDEADSCSCDDDVSSGCSSLDLNWEIHFSPPFLRCPCK